MITARNSARKDYEYGEREQIEVGWRSNRHGVLRKRSKKTELQARTRRRDELLQHSLAFDRYPGLGIASECKTNTAPTEIKHQLSHSGGWSTLRGPPVVFAIVE